MAKHKLDIQLSATAREDFVAILRYTLDSWGEAQMLRYRDQLNSVISSLAENP
jgi:plasmid stabilization system protein ParE